MKQKYLFKLLLFITLLAGHMYFYDPSLTKFVSSIKEASKLKLNDKFLLNSVIWVIGFWGMVLFLNSKHKVMRFSCWTLFAFAAFIEFAYVKTIGQSFALHNIDQLDSVFEGISDVDIFDMLQFIGLTALIIIISITIKPLDIHITRTFIGVLLVALVTVLIAYKGVNLVLPTFYLIPALMLYKYIIAIYKTMKSASVVGTTTTAAAKSSSL
jgi:hypothetical protein